MPLLSRRPYLSFGDYGPPGVLSPQVKCPTWNDQKSKGSVGSRPVLSIMSGVLLRGLATLLSPVFRHPLLNGESPPLAMAGFLTGRRLGECHYRLAIGASNRCTGPGVYAARPADERSKPCTDPTGTANGGTRPALIPPLPPTEAPTPTPSPAEFAGMHKIVMIAPPRQCFGGSREDTSHNTLLWLPY